TDVRELTDRVMIDIFKKKIRETETDPKRLLGTWIEAREILQNHFGKVSRIMNLNQYKLQRLYKTAIKELAKD
ncbi:MAG: hypothetical protein PVI17_08715, partial [Syntrophobacterales bacterium]